MKTGFTIPQSFAYARLPRAGLGNKLFVWARALVFARRNRLPLLISPWAQLAIGPLVRRERRSRLYLGYFRRPGAAEVLLGAALTRVVGNVVEPDVLARPGDMGRERSWLPIAYVFERLPDYRDYFYGLKSSRMIVRTELVDMLTSYQRQLLARSGTPAVAVHVRMGDFRPLKPGETYGPSGHTRVPLDYFLRWIRSIRQATGALVPVSVFTDGREGEIRELLDEPGTRIVDSGSDVVDLLVMGRSRVLITSSSSTFSYWSGFLSDGVVLHHPAHFVGTMRPDHVNRESYEGACESDPRCWPGQLIANIRALGGPSSIGT